MEKIFAGKRGGAVFSCPVCGFTKTFDASIYRNKDSRITIKCQCGQQIPVLIEFREHYRKQVNLLGECFLHRTNSILHIRIHDLSLNGLSFSLLRNTSEENSSFQPNDQIALQFYLDNASQDMIERNAIIKNINGAVVGVSFIRAEYDKALEFYLMR